MSELLKDKELTVAAGLRQGLGAAACAGCPFVELGCPKQGTGDCPPPQVIEGKRAETLLSDDSVEAVWAGADGGYFGMVTPKERFAKQPAALTLESVHIPRGGLVNIPKAEASQAERRPRPKGQSIGTLGSFAAALLLPAKKAK